MPYGANRRIWFPRLVSLSLFLFPSPRKCICLCVARLRLRLKGWSVEASLGFSSPKPTPNPLLFFFFHPSFFQPSLYVSASFSCFSLGLVGYLSRKWMMMIRGDLRRREKTGPNPWQPLPLGLWLSLFSCQNQLGQELKMNVIRWVKWMWCCNFNFEL